MNIIQHSDAVETEEGQWAMTFWSRKSKAELMKMQEIEKAMKSDSNLIEYINKNDSATSRFIDASKYK